MIGNINKQKISQPNFLSARAGHFVDSQHFCGHCKTCQFPVNAPSDADGGGRGEWRGSLLTRLRKQLLKLPIPSIFFSNTRSITHKVDDMEFLITANKSVWD